MSCVPNSPATDTIEGFDGENMAEHNRPGCFTNRITGTSFKNTYISVQCVLKGQLML